MNKTGIILATLWLVITTNACTQELAWPQFRGPNCSGHASETSNPPVEFGEDSHLKWKVELPEGTSSPVIWKDHLYLTACDKEKNEMQVLCLSRDDGSTIWKHSFYPEKLEGAHGISSPAQSTPALDQHGLYVYSAAYGVICYDHDGNVRWKNTWLPKHSHRWGHSVSPVVMDDKVILNFDFWGENNRGIIALSTHTGEIVWRNYTQKISPLENAFFTGYSTPVRYENQIILHRVMGVGSYSIEDGSPNWWFHLFTTGTGTPIVSGSQVYIPLWNHYTIKRNLGKYFDYKSFSDVIADFDRDSDQLLSKDEIPEDLKFASRRELEHTGYEGISNLVRGWFIDMDGDKSSEVDSVEWTKFYNWIKSFIVEVGTAQIDPNLRGEVSPESIRWMNFTNAPEVPSPVLVNGHIYTVKDGGWVTCIDAKTGDLIYSERLGKTGGYFASPVAANGKIYICAHRGIVQVIKASAEPEVLHETQLKGKILATPAIADDDLYIRTSEFLYAFSN